MHHIVVDEDIPYLNDWLKDTVAIHACSASAITPGTLKEADGVIIRTLTKIDPTYPTLCPKLQFIASATSGLDHIHPSLHLQKKPRIAHAPGCNAQAVCAYVQACFIALNQPKQYGRVGIIGLGHVGSLVKNFFSNLGFDTICYDPPKTAGDPTFISATQSALRELDVLCIHPSLTIQGPHKSLGLISHELLAQQSPHTIVIQASRGQVGDEDALIAHSSRLSLCVDVWQNEPHINQTLLKQATIATPHIAGYSTLAKWQASKRVAAALCKHFQLALPPMPKPDLTPCHPLDLLAIDQAWRASSHPDAVFHAMRKMETHRL